METSPQAQLAVLIDADNANAKRIDGLLAEVAKYGRATTKRAYGDWTTQNLGSWKQTLARHAIQPMQQFSNTKGKNSTDSALIIDAMDLLYTERFDGFCIVSSDSDFTRLASRIRESGLTVYGFGERKTPQPFVRACDRFIYVEVLRDGEPDTVDEPTPRAADRNRQPTPKPAAPSPAASNPSAAPAPKPAQKPAEASADERPARGAPIDDPALLGPLCAAVADAGDEDGWAGLGAVGSLLGKRMPEFDPRNYGRKKLSDLVAAIALFEVEERGEPGRSRALYVREKRVRDGERKAEPRHDVKPDARPAAKHEPRPEARPAVAPTATAASADASEARPAAPAPVASPVVASTSTPAAAPAPAARPTPIPPPRHDPRPPQMPRAAPTAAQQQAPDWAPRRDVRLPAWAEPKLPAASAPSPAAAAPAQTASAPVPAPMPTPATPAGLPPAPAVAPPAPAPVPAATAADKPAARPPRKAAAKKAAPVAADAQPVSTPEASAAARPKARPRKSSDAGAAAPAAGKAAKSTAAKPKA